MSGVSDRSLLDEVLEYLGLEPEEPIATPKLQPRTAFIAHRFDNVGFELADKLARFLELLGFRVVTGRAYSPGSVSSKLHKRIEEQSILFVVLTQGTDNVWLTQESVIGQVTGKPLFLLKDAGAEFKPGVLADHEYIPFTSPNLENAYVPILEGLRELGYLDFSKGK